MRVLICGSRKWRDTATITQRVHGLPEDTVVIHGGAHGADSIAGDVARRRGLHVAVVRANWPKFRKGAGPKRNAAMLALEPELVIAFTVGGELTSGTGDMVGKARSRGIPVEVHYGHGVAETPLVEPLVA